MFTSTRISSPLKRKSMWCSTLHGSKNPKILNGSSCDLTKKSDIYSLGVLFWQLTSYRPPFESEIDLGLDIRIINGKREIPIKGTNDEYIKLYQSKYKFSNGIHIIIFFCNKTHI
jgi:serine/threonine protein kinase